MVMNLYVWLLPIVAMGSSWLDALPDNSHVWIWGPYIPLLDETPTTSLAERYPDHGFVQLSLADEVLAVELVKRPPPVLWDPESPFCSSVLPAAIVTYLRERHVDIRNVSMLYVALEARPYGAACKCYVETFRRIGFPLIAGDMVGLEGDDIGAFCDHPHASLRGWPRGEVLPEPPSEAEERLLDSADFVLTRSYRFRHFSPIDLGPIPHFPDDSSWEGPDAISQLWVWGHTALPHPSGDTQYGVPLTQRYPEHGFIEISLDGNILSIDLVKRPPADVWPTDIKFCSSMLPASISQFFIDNELLLNVVDRVEVELEAEPFTAACKCYVRVMINMGFSILNGGPRPVNQTDVDEFCHHDHYSITGHLPVGEAGRLPVVPAEDMILLASASEVRRPPR